ncbi:MAG: hypothetical protein QXT53_05680 [Ignisphaera sp.]
MVAQTQSCINFVVKSVWYDTVDQPVIPIEITNSCSEGAVIAVDIKTPDNKSLHSEKIRLKPAEKRVIEITLSYYGDVVLSATGKLEKSDIVLQLGEWKLKL